MVEVGEGVAEPGAAVVAVAEGGDEVDGGGGADDAFVVLGSGLEALGAVVGSGEEFGRVEFFEEFEAAVEDADVRSVELVGGAGEEVAAPLLDVDEVVWCVVYGVDEDAGAVGVGEFGGAADVVDGAEGVGGGAEGEDPGTFRDSAFQVVPIELSGGGYHADGAEAEAVLPGDGLPGGDVGVVIEFGDDDLVAGLELAGEGAGEVEGEGGHVIAEGDLFGAGAEEVGHGLSALVEERVGLVAGRVVPVGVGVVVGEVVGHGVDDGAWRLSPAGPIEVSDRESAVLSLERGELRADLCHVRGDVGYEGGSGHALPAYWSVAHHG